MPTAARKVRRRRSCDGREGLSERETRSRFERGASDRHVRLCHVSEKVLWLSAPRIKRPAPAVITWTARRRTRSLSLSLPGLAGVFHSFRTFLTLSQTLLPAVIPHGVSTIKTSGNRPVRSHIVEEIPCVSLEGLSRTLASVTLVLGPNMRPLPIGGSNTRSSGVVTILTQCRTRGQVFVIQPSPQEASVTYKPVRPSTSAASPHQTRLS